MHRTALLRFALSWFALSLTPVSSQALRPFTVKDEIGIAHFGDPYSGEVLQPVLISPDSTLVAVHTERGLLMENRLEDEVRVYSVDALRRFASGPEGSAPPTPVWTIRKSTYREGLIISGWRWLRDSSGFAFLLRTPEGHRQIWLADVRHRALKELTPADQDVTAFDIRDAAHVAYAVRSPGPVAEMMKPGKSSAFVATGSPLYSSLMISTDDPNFYDTWRRSELWAVCGARPFLVRDSASHKPIVIYPSSFLFPLRLSPDGNGLAIAVPIEEVPKEWEARYPPPPQREAARLRAGHQDLNTISEPLFISVDVVIDLRKGNVTALTDAPDSYAGGWPTNAAFAWSDDGRSVLSPSMFLSSRPNQAPCIAMVVPSIASVECVQPLKYSGDELISEVRFEPGRRDRAIVNYRSPGSGPMTRTLARSANGTWEVENETPDRSAGSVGVDMTVEQGLNHPPVFTVADAVTKARRTAWDPNPQLKGIDLGEASVYRWKDRNGKDWKGGLFKPVNYVKGRRYPLVIQTHGFSETQFRPSGILPTAFAARALAAAGMVVLQVIESPIRQTPEEGPTQVRGYEDAVRQLDAEGLIDPDRIGIVGFSRTCYYVMEALTTSSLHFKAASVTDGRNGGYFEYVLTIDVLRGLDQRDAEAIIGSSPYGPGLEEWLKRSPEFNTDRINAPLQVVTRPGIGILGMWEVYAILHTQNKPVDLMVLNTGQHVLTSPGARLASQGGTVDWFRFWLQDYEDPDPAKKDQYVRWGGLRELQKAAIRGKR